MNIKEFVFWISIFFIFALGIYMLFYIKTNSFECISNPYTYSIKLLEKANNGNVTCLCSAQGNYGQSIMVKLTREGFETFDYFTNESNLKIPTVNLSNLIAAP